MDAKLSPPSVRRRHPWAVRPWTLLVLALLLVAGTLIQACSDNNGTTGPTFACNESPSGTGSVRALAACPQAGGKVPVVGSATGGPFGTLQVAVILPGIINSGGSAPVLVIVTNTNGVAVPGQLVRLTSTGGELVAKSGTTDSNGTFTTALNVPCDSGAGGSVVGIASGVTGSGTFAPGAPC